MYIHLDYKTLLQGEGEKHFVYIEITRRQGILSCKKRKKKNQFKFVPFVKNWPFHTPLDQQSEPDSSMA